ncbi:MAG: FAD-binding protein [Deltaproteobacteria bacterium]|nr:FAD-binding protein [Deltaproteobacteria bacterium]
MRNLGEVHAADVVILGGGIAGLIAAIRYKELAPNLDVLIVEKSTTGFSGSKANKGAGVVWVMTEDDDIDTFRDFYVREVGKGLEDQDLLERVCVVSREMIGHLERWGIRIMREEDGKLARAPGLPLWSLCAFDLDIMEKLRKAVVRLGVRTVDKTQSVELLTSRDGRRVTGAVGFDLIDGSFKIFKGKAVVLATGTCCWMVAHMWSAARGDGIAAAYRAGAEMRNAEFSNFFNLGLRGNMATPVGGQYALYNEEGEYLAPKYCKDGEIDIDIGILLGMEKEVMEGKGPIRLEETELFIQNPLGVGGFLFRWDRPYAKKFWSKAFEKEERYMADPAWRPEVIPLFIGECSPVKTDHSMKTTLEGLWALGDTNRAGTCWNGAVPSPGRLRGTGVTWAGVSALLSAESLTAYAAGADQPDVSEDQVARFKEEIYAPMARETGPSPREAISKLKDVIAPPRFAVRKSRERIEEALATARSVGEQVRSEVSPAKDWHLLGLTLDARNMAQCAEIYYESALHRTESRGWHYREDHPERDDARWRKWVVVRQVDGKPAVSTEEIPFQRYKTKI